jgi:tetratricopeptide (TPR) repeat protein
MHWIALLLALLAAPAGHRDKGMAALRAGDDDEAISEFSAAIKQNPADQVSHTELGKVFFKRGQIPQAIEHFQAAVKLKDKDATAWYNLAYASRKAQKFDDAAEAYLVYTKLNPTDPDGYFGLAESLRQAGKGKEAIAAYQAYIVREKRPTEQRWVQRARERIAELQQVEAAAPEKITLPQKPPAEPEVALVEKGPADAGAGVGDAGVSASVEPEPAPDAGPSAAMKVAEGDSLFAARDFRAALFAYQDAIMADPKSVEARVKAAQAYARLGHDDEAIEQWNKALQLDPQNAVAHESVGAAHERKAALAQRPGATIVPPLPPLTTAPVSDETGARSHYTAAVALIRERKYEQAMGELEQSLALKPGYVVALIARGSARIGLAKYKEAIADYNAAHLGDPSLAAPLFGLAEAYRALGQSEKAAEMYRQFAASNAPDAQANLKAYALQNAQALSPR